MLIVVALIQEVAQLWIEDDRMPPDIDKGPIPEIIRVSYIPGP
jgi:hypothetical protein